VELTFGNSKERRSTLRVDENWRWRVFAALEGKRLWICVLILMMYHD
jgi:hypothetical protein